MSEIDYAWAAGFIDADGTISMFRGKPRKEGHSYRYHSSLRATNRDFKALERLKNLFGGNIYDVKPQKGRKNSAKFYQWNCFSKEEVKKALDKLLPYLDIKKEHAKIVLEYIQDCNRELGLHKGLKLPEEVSKKRLKLWEKLNTLNAKGKEYAPRQ